MKKITLLTVVLLTFALVSLGAQIVDETSGLSFNVDGKGSATIGYDIESGDFGFSNSSSASIDLTLVGESSASLGGNDIYGMIELDDFQIYIDSDLDTDDDGDISYVDGVTDGDADGQLDTVSTATLPLAFVVPSITATIYAGPVYISIYGTDGMDSDKVGNIEGDSDGNYAAEDNETDLETDLGHDGGLTIGFENDMIDIGVMIASADDHSDGATSDISLGTAGSVEVDPMTISWDIVHNLDNASSTAVSETGVGVKAEVDVDMGDISIGAYGALDLNLTNSVTSNEIGLGLDLVLQGELDFGVDAVIGDATYTDTDIEVTVDTGDLLPIGVGATLGLYDLGGTSDTLILIDVDYAMDIPSGGTATTAIGVDVNIVDSTTTTVGLTFTETIADIFPNVEIEAEWSTSDISTDNGEFTLTTTVSY